MVIRDFNIVSVSLDESEADAPLIVDGDRILAHSVSGEFVESIPRWNPQVIQSYRQVDVFEF